jgi:hypothetical protein
MFAPSDNCKRGEARNVSRKRAQALAGVSTPSQGLQLHAVEPSPPQHAELCSHQQLHRLAHLFKLWIEEEDTERLQ